MKISDALLGVGGLGIDTAPYIYYVENHPIYVDKVDAIFQQVESMSIDLYSSSIVLTEVLMKPIKLDDKALINAYNMLLTDTDLLSLIPVTQEIASQAAYLRAKYNLRTPDALHITTAIKFGCKAFLTNDTGLKRVKELQVILLDELET